MKRPRMTARFLNSNLKNRRRFAPIIKYKNAQFHYLFDNLPVLSFLLNPPPFSLFPPATLLSPRRVSSSTLIHHPTTRMNKWTGHES